MLHSWYKFSNLLSMGKQKKWNNRKQVEKTNKCIISILGMNTILSVIYTTVLPAT